LILANDDLVAILAHLVQDHFGALCNINDLPLVHQTLSIGKALVLRCTDEGVLASRVDHFFLLSHRQSNLILSALIELFLHDDRARLYDISVVADHVQGQLEFASRWVEVLV